MSIFRQKIAASFCTALILAAQGAAGADVKKRGGSEPSQNGGRLTGSFEVGFDSFQEKYSILDEDTLDSVTEYRSRLNLGYMAGSFLRDFFHVEGQSLLGEDSYETSGRLKVTKLLRDSAPFAFGLDGDVTRRAFRDNSSYDFANDYTRYYVHSYVKKTLNETFALRLSNRLEHQNFDERTEFDYDYTRNRATLSGEFDWDLTTFVNGEVRYTTMSIPDSSDIAYRALTPAVEFRYYPGLGKRLVFYSSVERRNYNHEPARSSYWAVLATLSSEWPVARRFGIAVEENFEFYDHDTNSEVYFDYVENRSAISLVYRRAWSLRVGLGPTYGFLTSGFAEEDEYTEFGGKASFEFNRGTRVWFSVSYEPGKRSYSNLPESLMEESIYSDYVYHRVSAFANIKVWNGVGFNGLLDYQPEDHEREGDDATATLFSMSITYMF